MALSYFVLIYLEKVGHPQLSRYIEDHPHWGFEVLERFQFKKIKAKVLSCLRGWGLEGWGLVLMERIPRPREVLHFQARGERPVTMRLERLDQPIRHRKDAFDFFCHDLEHGAMFFQDQKLYQEQVKFFEELEQEIKKGAFDRPLLSENFREKFDYLISDMNTHPDHAKAYLNAILEIYGKTPSSL